MARRAAVAAIAALLLGVTGAPSARAAPGATTGMEDERVLFEAPEVAAAAVADWAALGIDNVRIHARWGEIAPAERPLGFSASDPDDPAYDWEKIDRAVELVRSAGMEVLLTVTGPGPGWTSRDRIRRDGRWRPDPAAFARYATAVGRRYRGRIAAYLIWNEPNQGGWLSPQWTCAARGRCTMTAPHLYRGLVRAAAPALRRVDPGAEILVGELAPIGQPGRSRSSPIAPLPFLRAFGCVGPDYRTDRHGACAHFAPVTADALGYHPHPVRRAPDEANPDPDEAALADLSRLMRVVDRLTQAGRIRTPDGGRLDLWLTEFGYQTSPPDHAIGISLGEQNDWLQQAAYLAWSHPRVRNLTHYQWEDEPVYYRGDGKKSYGGWQSGLRYVDGRAKPALETFRTPLVLDTDRARLWGQVRPGGSHHVQVEQLLPGALTYEAYASLDTDRSGAFTVSVDPYDGARYRFTYADGDAPSASASAVRYRSRSR